MLKIKEFQEFNNSRSKSAFGHTANEKSVTFWATATAGELGEACNLIKKSERGDKLPNLKNDLANELADVFIYLCMLASNQKIDLEDAIINKFNLVNYKKATESFNL